MKKLFIALLFILFGFNLQVYSSTDKYSQEYLQNQKHFSIFKPVAEGMVERGIKSALKKETGAKFDVKFSGYTLSSMKKGIFKSLEITGKDVKSNDIMIPYVHLKSLTDYNYVEYYKEPIQFKSDMLFAYDIELTEDSINQALADKEYLKTIKSVNKLAYPLFVVKKVRTKIINNRMYLIMDYNFPIIRASKDKVFVTSYDLKIENGVIKAKNVKLDSSYGNIPLDKVANLINYLNPLEFTLDLFDSKQCSGNVENVNIIDNKIKVDGKISVKGE